MEQKYLDYYLYCGIKSAWHTKRLEDFTNDDSAKRIVIKYLDQSKEMLRDGIGLFLWGANGTGKTHLAMCSAMMLIGSNYKVRVFSIDEVVDKFTSSWYSDDEKKELNDMLRNTDFLFIDEFGKNVDDEGKAKYLPDLVKRVMESVIRYRVQMHKPIWFTSNTDPAFVKEVFSEDIASLLNEAVVPVCVRGEDYRKVIQKRNKRRLQ